MFFRCADLALSELEIRKEFSAQTPQADRDDHDRALLCVEVKSTGVAVHSDDADEVARMIIAIANGMDFARMTREDRLIQQGLSSLWEKIIRWQNSACTPREFNP